MFIYLAYLPIYEKIIQFSYKSNDFSNNTRYEFVIWIFYYFPSICFSAQIKYIYKPQISQIKCTCNIFLWMYIYIYIYVTVKWIFKYSTNYQKVLILIYDNLQIIKKFRICKVYYIAIFFISLHFFCYVYIYVILIILYA